MKRKKIQYLLLGIAGLYGTAAYAQNIGINTGGAKPAASAVLDLNTGNNGTLGFLPPQVALSATNIASPLTSPDVGMVVYNTSTTGTAPNNVVPGYYYWTGSGWLLTNAPGVGNNGYVLTSNGGGMPIWGNPNNNLTRYNIVNVPNNGVTITNGTNQVVGSGNVTFSVSINSASANGLAAQATANNYAYLSDASGNPYWGSLNPLLKTNNVTTSTNGVVITNGSNQVIGGSNLTLDVASNSQSSQGLVPIPTSPNYIYATDASGNPLWAPYSASYLTTNSITSVNSVIGVGNGSNQVVGGVNLVLTPNTDSKNNPGFVAFTSLANANQVWGTDASGNPQWTYGANELTTSNVVTSTPAVTITNGTSQVVGASNVSINISLNTSASNGLVAAGGANNNAVWGTDGSGNPNWLTLNAALSPSNLLNGGAGSAIVIGNGTNQTVGSGNVTVDIQGTAGGVYYGAGAGNSAQFNAAGTANQLLYSKGAAAPAWTSATYPTGAIAINSLLYASGANAVTPLAPAANVNYVLSTKAANGPPSWSSINSNLVTNNITGAGNNVVTVGNGNGQVVGSANATVDVAGTAGGVLYGTGTSSKFTVAGSTSQLLYSNGSGSVNWTTSTFPTGSVNKNPLLWTSAANTVSPLNQGGNGFVMASVGGVPTWTTPASLNMATGTGITNYIARWTNNTNLGTGVSEDNGTDVSINSAAVAGDRLYVNEPTLSSTAIYGNNSAASGTGTGSGVIGTSLQSGGYGVLGINGASSGGTGVGGAGNGIALVPVAAGAGGAFTGINYGAYGYSATNPNGAGVYGTYNSSYYQGAGVVGVGNGGSFPTLANNGMDIGVAGSYGGFATGVGAGVVGLAGTGLSNIGGSYYAGVLGVSNDVNSPGLEGLNTYSGGYAVAAVNTTGSNAGAGLYVQGVSNLNGNLSLGASSISSAPLIFANSTNTLTVGIVSGVTSSSYNLVLPTSQGVANSILTNDGSGNLSWSLIGNYPITSANDGINLNNKILQLGGALVARDTVPLGGFNFDITGTGNVQFGAASNSTGALQFLNFYSPYGVTVSAGVMNGYGYKLTLPVAQSGNNQMLVNNGTGILSWATPTVTANDGLNVNNNTVQLGGTLTQNALVTPNGKVYQMAYDLGTGASPGKGTYAVTNGGTSNTYLQAQEQPNSGTAGQVGLGTKTPDASAALDITSGTGGMLLPRMTDAQVQAIATPTFGLMVWDITYGCIYFWNGSAWVELACPCGNTKPGNAGAITVNNATVCGGAVNETFSIATVAGATGYTWTESPNAFTITSGFGTNNITVTMPDPNSQTTETITVTPINGCGNGGSSTTTVKVNPAPANPGPITGPAGVCAGFSNSYSISAVSGATSYLWTIPSGATIANNGYDTATIYFAANGGGTVTVTPYNGSCYSGVSAQIIVAVSNGVPATPTGLGGGASICAGSNYTYTINAVSGANTYTWTIPAGSNVVSGQGTTALTMTAGSNSGQVTVTATNYCGTSVAATLTVTVSTGPPSAPVIGGSNNVCALANVTYTVAPVAGATSYTWTYPASWTYNSGQGTTALNMTAPAANGTVLFTCTAVNGCGSSTTAFYSVFSGVSHGTSYFYYNGSNQYNGSLQSFVVPNCVSTMTVELWGAGGGQGYYYGSVGGSSAYMQGTINVTAGQTIYVVVGAGGAYLSENSSEMYGGGGWEYYGGCGGGRAAIQFVSGTDIATSAGGGGGGNGDDYYYSFYYGMGGAGYYGSTVKTAGQGNAGNGWSSGECTTDFGYAAICTAGGTGALGECGSYTTYSGFAGTQYVGATSGYSYYGGGGGGGYWGGGGGAGIYCTGGGGGSCFPCGNSASFTIITAASGSTNPNTTYRNTRLYPAGTTSPHYNVGNPSANPVGSSISTFEANPGISGYGGNGEVVFTY